MCKKDSNYFKVRLAGIMFDNYTIEERTKKIESFLNELNEYVNDDNSEEIKQLQNEIKNLRQENRRLTQELDFIEKTKRDLHSLLQERYNIIKANVREITELKCEIADLHMQIKKLQNNG